MNNGFDEQKILDLCDSQIYIQDLVDRYIGRQMYILLVNISEIMVFFQNLYYLKIPRKLYLQHFIKNLLY